MTGLHVRRYELKPHAMPGFLDWWRQIRPIRERHGFRLMFAIYLPEPNEFVSAWSTPGSSTTSSAATTATLTGAVSLMPPAHEPPPRHENEERT